MPSVHFSSLSSKLANDFLSCKRTFHWIDHLSSQQPHCPKLQFKNDNSQRNRLTQTNDRASRREGHEPEKVRKIREIIFHSNKFKKKKEKRKSLCRFFRWWRKEEPNNCASPRTRREKGGEKKWKGKGEKGKRKNRGSRILFSLGRLKPVAPVLHARPVHFSLVTSFALFNSATSLSETLPHPRPLPFFLSPGNMSDNREIRGLLTWKRREPHVEPPSSIPLWPPSGISYSTSIN